jgi:hypothetical protein
MASHKRVYRRATVILVLGLAGPLIGCSASPFLGIVATLASSADAIGTIVKRAARRHPEKMGSMPDIVVEPVADYSLKP